MAPKRTQTKVLSRNTADWPQYIVWTQTWKPWKHRQSRQPAIERGGREEEKEVKKGAEKDWKEKEKERRTVTHLKASAQAAVTSKPHQAIAIHQVVSQRAAIKIPPSVF